MQRSSLKFYLFYNDCFFIILLLCRRQSKITMLPKHFLNFTNSYYIIPPVEYVHTCSRSFNSFLLFAVLWFTHRFTLDYLKTFLLHFCIYTQIPKATISTPWVQINNCETFVTLSVVALFRLSFWVWDDSFRRFAWKHAFTFRQSVSWTWLFVHCGGSGARNCVIGRKSNVTIVCSISGRK